ncbi:MAG: hypothetical protein JSV32_06465 [Dehalococcoidia bacterium]|nr:MAG: hypothetical protein JSV32_06465 [Dehalococcoidia bacterium]
MIINTIEELHQEYLDFGGTDSEFNYYLLDLLYNHQMPGDVFIEYLEVTQGDVCECLEEGLA